MAAMEPHQLADLLQGPTLEQQLQHVAQHLDYVLPRLAASSTITHFTTLPSASVLEAHLHTLQTEHDQILAPRTAQLEQTLRQQLVSSLSGVQLLKERLSSLPDEISSTEDRLLELCEDLVIAPSSSGDGAPTLMKRLDELHDAIQQLQKAKAYFIILAQAEDLRLLIQKQDTTASTRPLATNSLTELDALVKKYERLAAKQGQEFKFIPFLRAQRSTAFAYLARVRGSRLSEALAQAGWGDFSSNSKSKRSVPLNNEVMQAWSELCQLQDSAEALDLLRPASAKSASLKSSPAGSDGYQPLLATQFLVEPLLLRFRYHFDGDRPTNRLDKPEWYLSQILSLIEAHISLFEPATHGQPGSGGDVARLCRHHANADYASRRAYRYLNTDAELIHAFLTPLRRKLASSMPSLLDHPSLLAHTVFQALTFDADLLEKLPPTLGVMDVHKISDDILANETWFQRWLEGEKVFAVQRFDEIMDSSDAWAIGSSDTLADDDDTDQQVFNKSSIAEEGGRSTTRSARSIVQILDSVSERYRPLPSLEQRLAFLAIVQLPILRAYATRLTKSLDAFESLSSAFARAMPGEIAAVTGSVGAGSGSSDTDMVKGLRGLGRLLKALLSAQYVCSEVERWSETAFFVELSHELQSTEHGQKLALGLRKDQTAEEDRELDAASLSMLLRRGLKRGAAAARPLHTAAPDSHKGSGFGGIGTPNVNDVGKTQVLADFGQYGVWEEPHRKFSQLVDRATRSIERLVTSEVLEQLRPYTLQAWNTESDQLGEQQAEDEDGGAIAHQVPTPTLIPALSLLSTHLSHLATVLDTETMLPLYRRIASTLSAALVERVIISGGSRRFTYAGGLRLSRDVQQGWLGVVSDLSNSSNNGPALYGRRPQAAWKQIRDACMLLTLPHAGIKASATPTHAGYTISRATQIAFDTTDDDPQNTEAAQAYRQMLTKLDNIDDSRLNVREVLRRRVEVWK